MTAETRQRFFAHIAEVYGLRIAPALNALGKPLNPKHDPSYRMAYRTPKLKGKPGAKRFSPDHWDAVKKAAGENWEQWAAEEEPSTVVN